MLKNSLPFFLFVTVLFILNVDSAKALEAGPFKGRIVDSVTKEPIEGVVVFIKWEQLNFFTLPTFIDTQETLTDKEGKFYIPGIWIFNPWRRFSTHALIIIYKSGYGSTSRAGGQIYGGWYHLLEIEWGDPKGTIIWKFENGNPVIMLKKLTEEERKGTDFLAPTPYNVPEDKMKLLTEEANKEKEYEFKNKTRR